MKLDKEIFAKCKVYFDKLVPYGFINPMMGLFLLEKIF